MLWDNLKGWLIKLIPNYKAANQKAEEASFQYAIHRVVIEPVLIFIALHQNEYG
jgi:hypothetical protein